MNNPFPSPLVVEAHSYLAAIVESSDDAIISKDLNGNITSWNRAAERIFGYTAQETIGKHISILIPPEYLSEEDYIIGQIRSGNRLEHFEAIRRSKDGRMLNLSLTVSPIKNSSGVIIGASKVARDVTRLKEAERASAYFSAIVESSDDAIISKDLNGYITSWNRSAERIFGYAAQEIIGRHITTIIPAERISEEDKILTTLKNGDRIDHYETVRRHKHGHLVPISLTVSPIRDSSGNIIGASKVARDVSDRLLAAQSIQEASLKKDEFLAHMSHELRTPMNAVIGLAHLLKTMELPDKAVKFVDTLHLSACNLLELINDMLDFAKIESGSVAIEEVEFNLAKEVEKVIRVINVKAQEKKLGVYVDFAPNLHHHYVGDPLRIHQCLMNLMSNAVKFTDKGFIKVSVSAAPHANPNTAEVILSVKDTGTGIPQDKIDSIFEKFTQADSSITRRFGGTGLGLSITRGFVEKMGGRIVVESEIGVGSTFAIHLPLRISDCASAHEEVTQQPQPTAPQHTRNVLLVEDYEPNVLVTSSLLDKLGYNYDVASNGLEAIRRFVHGHYDVVLMDVQMASLDGLEATRRIRRIEAEKAMQRTPIVAMTAHVREQDKQGCVDAGMDDFIPKPFDPAELAQKLAQFVSAKAE